MKLNEKVLAFLLIFFIVIISVTLIAGSSFYLQSYEKLDESRTVSNVQNAVHALNTSRTNDLRILSDWAVWDDTYDYISNPEHPPAFIEHNLLPVTYRQLGFDFFVLSDLNGTVIWGRTSSETDNTLRPLPTGMLAAVNMINREMTGPRMGETESGIIMVGNSPFIVATAPVTHTDGSGPVAGRITLGSSINADLISQIAAVSSPSVAILPAGDLRIPGAIRYRLEHAPALIPFVAVWDEDTITGYVLLDDLFDVPALVITIDEHRTFFHQGLSSLISGIFMFLGISALLGSLTLIMVDRYVLRRLGLLRDAADEIRKSGTISGEVDVGGDDELSDVAVAFNQMIRTIGENQRELAGNREYLDRIFTSVKAGIMVIDAATHAIIDINPAGVTMLKEVKEEIIGRTCHSYFRERGPKSSPAVSADGGDNPERVLLRADGTELSVLRNATRLNIRGRDCLLETFIDNTERRQMEQALRESEEKFRNLAENTADILFTLDRSGQITYVSPQVSQYGYAPEELIGRSFTILIHPEDAEKISRNFSSEMTTGRQVASAFRIIDRKGSIFWVEERSNILFDGTGKVRGMQGVIRDITDRKKAEDAIRLANRKLNLLNDITRHDIVNTLTGLLGTVEMARDPAMASDRDLLLADVRTLGLNIQKQIEFTREYQAVGIKEPVWQNVSEIIQRAANLQEGSRIMIVNDITPFEVFADPLLEKVFYNLIQNALSYGNDVHTIRFTEGISDRGFAIVCEDNGGGIPPEMKEKIFGRGIGQNTGMGLFLSREILGITGITIRENGMFGKGARFEMVIPKGGYRFCR